VTASLPFLNTLLILVAAGGCQSGTPELYDAWVGFSDKGLESQVERDAAFQELERSFDPRALNRRRLRRTRPGLFDEHDLPLQPRYLQAVAETGAEVRVRSRWLNGVSVLATRDQLERLESLPFVSEVSDLHHHVPKGEREGRIPVDPDLQRGPGPDEVYGWSGPQIRQLNLHRLHAAGFRGEGVRIGVVDTGFLTDHRVFRNPANPLRITDAWDFMDNDPVTSPEDGDSPRQLEHGALILGILAANLPGALVGSAPDAEYILLKAEDDATEYFLEEKWFVAALEYAEARGADIISSSVVLYEGYEEEDVDGHTSVMAQGWALAVGNGVIGLQGGGNAGHDDDPSTHHFLPPAGAPGVITVGAADPSGGAAPFSSDGLEVAGRRKPELLAWGRQSYSVSPYEPDAYTTANGTSMATPLLAGAVACLLQAHPDWTVRQVEEALFQSGSYVREHGVPDPLLVQGYGIPDLAAAAGIYGG
jgi:subtilisin family serine protease